MESPHGHLSFPERTSLSWEYIYQIPQFGNVIWHFIALSSDFRFEPYHLVQGHITSHGVCALLHAEHEVRCCHKDMTCWPWRSGLCGPVVGGQGWEGEIWKLQFVGFLQCPREVWQCGHCLGAGTGAHGDGRGGRMGSGKLSWSFQPWWVEVGHRIPTEVVKQRPQASHLGLNNLHRMSHSAAISHVIGWLNLGGNEEKVWNSHRTFWLLGVLKLLMWFPDSWKSLLFLIPSFPS